MKEKRIVVIVFYVFYSLSTDLLTTFLDKRGLMTDKISTSLLSLFTIVEFSCFSLFFYFTLTKPILRKLIMNIIVFFIIYCITNFFFQFNINGNLDTIPVTFQAIYIMSLCVIYFFEQMSNPNSLFIYSTGEFWIVTGILIFLAGTFFIFIYSADLSEEEFLKYWPINYLFNAIKNILFGLALFIHGRKKSKPNEDDAFYYQSLSENP